MDDTLKAMIDAVDGPKHAGTPAAQPYLLVMVGDVEPALLGPFAGDQARLDAARRYRDTRGDRDGLYRVDSPCLPTIRPFSGAELEAE